MTEEEHQRAMYSGLDDLDRGIVGFLQENARIPFTQIAKELNVTEKTVRLRVQQMQDEGVLSLVGIVNPVKAGIRSETLIFIAVENQMMEEVTEAIHEMPEVRLMLLISGEYQLMLQVFTKDTDEFSEFLMKKLNKVKGITRTNVIMELKVLKSKLKFVR
ncbi:MULTISPECIES: Lrp/AsnC family transcriptional regulator [unclassified Paenibacillus]|uniref:Lrp/AsnC family transcriptional regulator n=1 Tax=Paenibacillus provencensis TaxID=441151 RepID=A0ABW3Q0C8_9BACL|nr:MULTISPECIES: Lrp/AsnC family transcriptional regulator [unclassified Paenibacillus]MCM3129438.1 Lrp/AsnC family transcriptional regulator [Paenibacillus sp. MER 78]SFS73206.1 Lrp/AsnC family transcriptional regulator, regulator for asnA, asnC and gidA [Paenibacillus sp. 453mf]